MAKGGTSAAQTSTTQNTQPIQDVSAGGPANVVSISGLNGKSAANVTYNITGLDAGTVRDFLVDLGAGAADITTKLTGELSATREAVTSIATSATGSQTEFERILRSLITPLAILGGLALVAWFAFQE